MGKLLTCFSFAQILEMKRIEARRLINKIQRDLLESGVRCESIVPDLKTLRPFAIEEKDPQVTKTIRLVYEHLEIQRGFFIPLPEDEAVDEEGYLVEKIPVEEGLDTQVESLNYLLELIFNSKNKMNRVEINEYKEALMVYGR